MQFYHYAILALALLTTGCAPTLQQWTEQELSPYLVKELAEHPRFKQQPIILVDMHGEQVEPQIDNLTATLRDQIFNKLLQNNGVNLIWQASNNSLQHQRSLQTLECHAKQKARFYIGFDIKPVSDQFQVSVKALDPEQERWVSGFGKSWQGSLSKQQQQQLKQTQTDEVLRGLRPLPFSEQQIDLLAGYLAKNVSCLLQQSSLEKLAIYPESTTQQNVFLHNTLSLVGHYLSRFNEVQIVSQAKKANIILKIENHRIDKDLHQLWLVAENKTTGENLKGIDTAAYVNLSTATLVNRPPAPLAPPKKPQPIRTPAPLAPPQKPQPMRPPAPLIAPQQKPRPAPPRDLVQAQPVTAHLFKRLYLIRPIGESFCQTSNPWVMGEYQLTKQSTPTSCFGLNISLNQSAEVFLINENQGQYARLLPDNAQTRFQLFAGEQIRYPESNLFTLDPKSKAETIHAIAVNQPQVANKLRNILRAMPICCEQGYASTAYWKHRLERLRQQYGEYIDWQRLEIRR